MSNTIPYIVEAAVCKSDCICYDPITHHEKVYTYQDNNGDEVLMLPAGHIKPGVWVNGKPVISPEQLKRR